MQNAAQITSMLMERDKRIFSFDYYIAGSGATHIQRW
jgi:hypothetical protein